MNPTPASALEPPSGGSPASLACSRKGLPDVFVAALGILLYALFVELLSRQLSGAGAAPVQPLLVALAAVAALAWGVARLLRRGDDMLVLYVGMGSFSSFSAKPAKVLEAAGEGAWPLLLALVALLPALLSIWVVWRLLRRKDELWRQINYEAMGWAFFAALIGAVALWMLDEAGGPLPPPLWLLPALLAFYAVGALISWRRYR